MESSKIVVVGSMNMDHVVNCQRLPEPGETIKGEKFNTHPGGKGANQAAAVGQLGGEPLFIGARGRDNIGSQLENHLQEMGVQTNLKLSEKSTGSAHIFVTSDGENHIVIIPGANDTITPEDIRKIKHKLKNVKVVLLQLEIPLDTVVETARISSQMGAKVLLDPAPVKRLPQNLLKNVDYLLPNNQEFRQMTPDLDGESIDELDRVRYLHDKGVGNIVVTRGEKGVLLFGEDGRQKLAARKVDVVDTTAAGDAFAGAFALGLAAGLSNKKAARLGIAYGSAAVTGAGAQSSLLNREEFSEFAPEMRRLLP